MSDIHEDIDAEADTKILMKCPVCKGEKNLPDGECWGCKGEIMVEPDEFIRNESSRRNWFM